MGKLFEGFKILCTDFDHILEKRGETIQEWLLCIQGRILIKEIRYALKLQLTPEAVRTGLALSFGIKVFL